MTVLNCIRLLVNYRTYNQTHIKKDGKAKNDRANRAIAALTSPAAFIIPDARLVQGDHVSHQPVLDVIFQKSGRLQ